MILSCQNITKSFGSKEVLKNASFHIEAHEKAALIGINGALELKEQLVEHLKKRGIECKDYGTYTKDSCDYPVYARKVAEAILSGECEEGILLCGTGIGMSMAANKIKGIRAALCSDCFSAQATKEHNNANVLCMGARVIGPELAFRIADTFLDSKFSNDERHIRRISMLED